MDHLLQTTQQAPALAPQEVGLEYRRQEIFRVAAEMFDKRPHWVTFFREILGVEGVMRRLLPESNDLQAFEQSEEFMSVQKMLTDLRHRKRTETQSDDEPTQVITIRIPSSMHKWLLDEAKGAKTSMNKLCITKLLQVIGEEEANE